LQGGILRPAAVDMMRQMSQQCFAANIARQFHQVITAVLA